MQLVGKVALVTGAGARIGRASAEAFAGVGASVVVVDLDEATAIVAAGRMRSASGAAVVVQADVSLAADIRRTLDETRRVFGGRHCP